ncbi:MAG: hypothetical protein LBT18_03065 [Endomicrobium sp.]|jgi:hypothetical protein|nr:hypothetical protein [Endomicrobium sp.]
MKKLTTGLFVVVFVFTIGIFSSAQEASNPDVSEKVKIKAEAKELKKIKSDVKEMKKQSKNDENLVKKKAARMKDNAISERKETILEAKSLENKAKVIRNNTKNKEKKELKNIAIMLREANKVRTEADKKADTCYQEAIQKLINKNKQT